MHGPLEGLLADGVLDEICGRLKSGKEADAYREGRQVRNTRTQRAMDRGTRFGQAAAEDAWKAKESDALHTLHAAGVRVPKPVLFYEGILLMELVLDAHRRPAPRLVDAHVGREVAGPLYADLRGQAIRMLRCDLIHGDLSPYNVLLGPNGPVVIDLPQVIGAAHNSQAESFFVRDLENIRRFLAAIDPSLRARSDEAPRGCGRCTRPTRSRGARGSRRRWPRAGSTPRGSRARGDSRRAAAASGEGAAVGGAESAALRHAAPRRWRPGRARRPPAPPAAAATRAALTSARSRASECSARQGAPLGAPPCRRQQTPARGAAR